MLPQTPSPSRECLSAPTMTSSCCLHLSAKKRIAHPSHHPGQCRNADVPLHENRLLGPINLPTNRHKIRNSWSNGSRHPGITSIKSDIALTPKPDGQSFSLRTWRNNQHYLASIVNVIRLPLHNIALLKVFHCITHFIRVVSVLSDFIQEPSGAVMQYSALQYSAIRLAIALQCLTVDPFASQIYRPSCFL